MAELKQITVKPPAPPSASADVTQQIAGGSNRQKGVREVGDERSKNYIPGEQGWRMTDTNVEFNGARIKINSETGLLSVEDADGRMTINTNTPRILVSDGTNDRIVIGLLY
jgi:hypothetical protein